MDIEKKVIQALNTVDDPDLKQSLVELGMIKDLKINQQHIYFEVELTTPACPLKEKIKNDCIQAIEKAVGQDYEIAIKMGARVVQGHQQSKLSHIKNIIAIASGKGGVGKSTVTANLAIALAQTGAKVGIIDADIFGPSIPIMFNCEFERPSMDESSDKGKIIPITQYGIQLISIGFLTPPDQAVIWRGPMASSALRQFINDVAWGELDYLLVDLPPGTSDIHLTLVQAVPVAGAVIVTTPQKVALADAQKGIAMFRQAQINIPLLGLVENMSYFTPPELPEKKYYIFGQNGGKQLASNSEIPFLGEIPIQEIIRDSGDKGYPATLKNPEIASAFKGIAEKMAQELAIKTAKKTEHETIN